MTCFSRGDAKNCFLANELRVPVTAIGPLKEWPEMQRAFQSSRSSPEHDLLFVMAALGPGHPRLSACCYPTWMAGIANKPTQGRLLWPAHDELRNKSRTQLPN
jgi:hypothetical protein